MELKRLMVATSALLLPIAACGGETTTSVETILPVATTEELASCEAGDIDGDLHLYSRADYIDPRLVSAFEDEHGIDVLEDSFESNDELFAKLQSGAVYDLVLPSDYMVSVLIEEGFLGEIQHAAIPNLEHLAPRFADPAYDRGGRHSVALVWGTVGLAVDREEVDLPENAGWELVFDPEAVSNHEGGVSLLDDPRQTMGAALKYLGHSLNSTDPEELQAAADAISAVTGLGLAFDSDGTARALVDGEVDILHGRSDVLGRAVRELDRFVFLTPADGAAVWVDTMAITVNAGHPCTAHTFIDYLLEPQHGAAITNWTLLASANRAALANVDPPILDDPSVYPPEGVGELLEMLENLGSAEAEYAEYFAIARS